MTIPATERRTAAKPTSAMLYLTTNRGDLEIPPTVFTLDGFREWAKADDFPEKVKVAFIDGMVYVDMGNEELFTHVAVKGEISRVWSNLNQEHDLGECFPDGGLVTHEEANVSNNPDAIFVIWKTLESGLLQFIPREGAEGQYTEILGAPDAVLEVISKSSVQKDTVRLREAYHRAGVREYWLIDARGDDVEFQILYWRKRGFAAGPVQDGWQRSRVLGREFRFQRTRNRAGRWRCLLEVRP